MKTLRRKILLAGALFFVLLPGIVALAEDCTCTSCGGGQCSGKCCTTTGCACWCGPCSE